MNPVRPSPAITVRSDTPIGEVVRIMRERNVGSVLILESSHPFRLVGIFTERDLVRWVMEINAGQFWDKPIISVMSKNLITLHISDLEQAPEIMLKNNIRHLPVIFQDERKVEHLAGVISMRDLFRRFVRGQEPSRELARGISPAGKKAPGAARLALVSNDRSTRATIENVVGQSPGFALQVIDVRALTETVDAERPLPEMDTLIFDIDFCANEKWPFLLRTLLRREDAPNVLAVFDPLLHSGPDLNSIKVLSSSPKFAAFAKPLNLLLFFKRLRVWSAA